MLEIPPAGSTSALVPNLGAVIGGDAADVFVMTLVGSPEPLGSLVHRILEEGLAREGMLGDPAGRPVFEDWWDIAGDGAAHVPFLSYQRPGELSDVGKRMAAAFELRHGREPSFVALEGYDAALAVIRAAESIDGLGAPAIRESLRTHGFEGTRGTVRFSTRPSGVIHQQWAFPPVVVVQHSRARGRLSELEVLWDGSTSTPG
jgi:Periplasmic binding protein